MNIYTTFIIIIIIIARNGRCQMLQDGSKNTECQLAAIKIFNSQLERTAENQNYVLVLGDANLCHG